MTSIYFIISTETRHVTHFGGYKTIALHEKAILYVLSHDFLFFRLLKYYKILRKYSFCTGYSDILNKPEAIVYFLCFKKQTLELLLYLSSKAELPKDGI